MTIDQLLDYMYENHRIRRQKDIAKFFNVSTQAVSNWKRSGRVPAKYALKIQVSKPTDYKELVETLTDVLISLNKNIKEIKSIQAISNISAQYFSDGVFSDKDGIPIVRLINVEGDWEKFDNFVKIGGFVNCNPNYSNQPIIINGASDLLVKIFGDKGRHTRVAVGSNSLPLDISVEIDAIIKIK